MAVPPMPHLRSGFLRILGNNRISVTLGGILRKLIEGYLINLI